MEYSLESKREEKKVESRDCEMGESQKKDGEWWFANEQEGTKVGLFGLEFITCDYRPRSV